MTTDNYDIITLGTATEKVPSKDDSAVKEIVYRRDSYLPEEIALMRTMFDAGVATGEIARALARGTAGVATKMADLGWTRNTSRPWTGLEDEALVQHYRREPTLTLANRMNRSAGALYARARHLGISNAGEPGWSAGEDELLKAAWQKEIPIARITTLLDRTGNAIISRASDLGLRRPSTPENWTEEERARVLVLAETGMTYAQIARTTSSEGWPKRSKVSIKNSLRALGYERGWGRPWLQEEEDALRRAYADGSSIAALAIGLGRTRSSAMWKASELGLKGTHVRKNGFRSSPDWTKTEDAYLRESYGRLPSKAIARELGRALAAVYNRAWILGLKTGYAKPYSPDEDRAIRIAHRHNLRLTDIARAAGRDPSALCRRAAKLGLSFSAREKPASQTPRAKQRPVLTLRDILAFDETPAESTPPQKPSERNIR